MRKTTIYFSEAQSAGLARISAETGRSQSELIRAAVESLIADRPRGRFRSLGVWDSGRPAGTSIADEDVDAVLRAGLRPDSGWS